jgi:hypothetical protein
LTVAHKKLLKINTGQGTIVPDKFLAAFPISLDSPTKLGKLRRYRPMHYPRHVVPTIHIGKLVVDR